jgi:ribonuclease HI
MTQGYIIISDGACSKNPGPGGWGLIVVSPSGEVNEFGGSEESTTNNRMELFGVYRGLQEVYRDASRNPSDPAPGIKPNIKPNIKQIKLVSDSKYVLDGFEKSLDVWPKRGWKTVAGEPVKNQDLWEKILKGRELLLGQGFRFSSELVKGHSGSDANERVDQIAVKFSQGGHISLYAGPISNYSISLESGARFEPVYLSLVQGKLNRHVTWDECKRVTEGQKGARYKKVKNRMEEQETLKAWGLI